jgi:hypothetical protein
MGIILTVHLVFDNFISGEILKMSQYVNGIDSNGVLQFEVIVRGSVPELPDNADIQLYPYTEDYIQRQTGSRNLMGSKTLPTIWGTYMKLVTKYHISAINSC